MIVIMAAAALHATLIGLRKQAEMKNYDKDSCSKCGCKIPYIGLHTANLY